MLRTSLVAVGRVHSNRALRRLQGRPKFLKKYDSPPPALEPLRWAPAPVTLPPTGYLPPQGGTPADLPFRVARTEFGKQLPIYSDFRNGRTRKVTILRKIDGDVETLKTELKKVCSGAEVTERPGHVEVAGEYRGPIKLWLLGLGF